MRAENISDVVKPLYYILKAFGYINCHIKTVSKYEVVLNLVCLCVCSVLYTYTTYFTITVQNKFELYASRIQYSAFYSVFVASLLLVAILVVGNLVVGQKIGQIFQSITEIDKKLFRHRIHVDLQLQKRVLLKFLGAIFTGACILGLIIYFGSSFVYQGSDNVWLAVLHCYCTVSLTLYIGKVALLLLAINVRFSLTNKLFR